MDREDLVRLSTQASINLVHFLYARAFHIQVGGTALEVGPDFDQVLVGMIGYLDAPAPDRKRRNRDAPPPDELRIGETD